MDGTLFDERKGEKRENNEQNRKFGSGLEQGTLAYPRLSNKDGGVQFSFVPIVRKNDGFPGRICICGRGKVVLRLIEVEILKKIDFGAL